jgi:general secretion pathway protein J
MTVEPPDCEAGFTLVELLVALALFSLLCTLMFGNVRFGMRAWQYGAAHAEQVDHTMVVQGVLRRIIEEAYPYFLVGDPTRPHVDFNGKQTSLDFLSSALTAAGAGPRYRFLLTADKIGGKTDLAITSRPELVSAEDAATTRTVLLADIERVEFSYFGATLSDSVAQWRNEWLLQAAAPQLVRVRTWFPAHDGRTWPDLLITPRISADVNCVYDALTKRCRGR